MAVRPVLCYGLRMSSQLFKTTVWELLFNMTTYGGGGEEDECVLNGEVFTLERSSHQSE